MLQATRALSADLSSQPIPQSPTPSRPAPSTPASTSALAWAEPEESFLRLSLRNLALTIATLGIYHFWGAAEARRRLYSSIRINGAPLSFAASGRDGFIGFASTLLVAAIMTAGGALAVLALNHPGGIAGVLSLNAALAAAAVPDLGPVAASPGTLLSGEYRYLRMTFTLPLLFLLGSVAYRRHRDHLAKIDLTGQRFRLGGNPWRYAWTHFWTALTVPLTLGWTAPWRAMVLQRLKTENTHLGTERLTYTGLLAPRYKPFAALWVGGILVYLAATFGLGLVIGDEILLAVEQMSLAPLARPGIAQKGLLVVAMGLLPFSMLAAAYRAETLSRDVSAIRAGAATLALDLPRWQFAAVVTSGRLMKLASLGTLAPVADARLVRFVLMRVRMDGTPRIAPSEGYEVRA